MIGYKKLLIICDYGSDSSTCCNTYPIKYDFDLTEEALINYGELTCETFNKDEYYLEKITFHKKEKTIEVFFYSDWRDKEHEEYKKKHYK